MKKKEQDILTAAKALFLHNGLKKTTMEQIAKEANVSKATLYKYFSDKEMIIEIFLRQIFESVNEILVHYITDKNKRNMNNVDFIKIFDMNNYPEYVQSDFVKELFDHYPKILNRYFEWIDQEMMPVLEDFFLSAQKEGILRTDIDAKMIVRYVWIMQQSMRYIFNSNPELLTNESFKVYKQSFNDIFLHGVLNKEQ